MAEATPEQTQASAEYLILHILEHRKLLRDQGDDNPAHEKHIYQLIDRLLWKHSEAYGKYKGCRYWSKGAQKIRDQHYKKITKTSATGLPLRHEHVFPREQSIALFFGLDEITEEAVSKILALNHAAVVTKEEDKKLSKKGNRANPWQRYIDAGVDWDEL